ncbi:MAG TPA: 2Fe-2S iron-sulfur cluster binding domain-containing protein [Usitatibacter sp.]|nr:2Fe-2S iron-sulfur cluster binding domain-containing protein [Usitatibacter sp.]
MPTITFITNGRKVVTAPENSNLLRISLREKGGIPFKCGGGLCGTCRCLIESGIENTDAVKDKERNHLSEEDLKNGYRMACQTFVLGDVSVSWEARKPSATVAIDREGLVLARASSKP